MITLNTDRRPEAIVNEAPSDFQFLCHCNQCRTVRLFYSMPKNIIPPWESEEQEGICFQCPSCEEKKILVIVPAKEGTGIKMEIRSARYINVMTVKSGNTSVSQNSLLPPESYSDKECRLKKRWTPR